MGNQVSSSSIALIYLVIHNYICEWETHSKDKENLLAGVGLLEKKQNEVSNLEWHLQITC